MIQSYTFGRMVVDHRLFTSDLKIIDGQVIDDWYREGGHRVAVEDVGDILSAMPKVVVFGTGDQGRMQVSELVKKTLEKRNIEFIERPTAEAKETFNRMVAEGRSVAGAFHLTC